MTTPSTTVFVDGTPNGRSASEATSVTSEDNLLQPSVMRRRHFELMAVPVARDDHRYPSSASFNASIDQQVADGNRDGVQPPTDQDPRDKENRPSTPIQNHDDHLSISHLASSSHHPLDEPPNPAPSTSRPPSSPAVISQSAAIYQPPEPSTSSSPVQPAPQPPSTPPNPRVPSVHSTSPPSTHHRIHQHRRRRLLRWLRRRLDHPLPWTLDLRRRADNVRRRIRDVDRVLP